MAMDLARAREYLRALDFESLFIEELGWDIHRTKTEVSVDGQKFSLAGIAEKHGMAVLACTPRATDVPPDYQTRLKIERQVVKLVHEHILVFVDKDKETQVWQWVKREPGKPAACREHTLYPNQSGDALLQKLQAVAFSLEEEADITIRDVTSRVRAVFDVERVTKRFYDRFKIEHEAFLKFIKGIPDKDMHRWYVSVMLNRLMFIYFVQKKGFLDSNPDYLRDKLVQSKQRGKDRFYRDFLCALFFKGFARKEEDRSAATRKLLGRVPYLNGGIFQVHEIEERYGKEIRIADTAFDKLFAFFDQYRWRLDERPLHKGNEINPDVLGYIFEKYINQKQMGAYYTKEDITGYICRNTVVPRIFDMARDKCKVAFEGEQSVWRLLQENPDRYIYDAVRKGVIDKAGDVIPESRLPDFVQKGMHDPKARMFDKRYNLREADLVDDDGKKLTLPTETWREYVARRTRCLELRQKLAVGEVRDINDLITYNLDICQFAQDVVEQCEGPELLRAVWRAIAGRVPDKSNQKPESGISILDPACGSGAFLFAALNILETLYEACLDRMQTFLDELETSGKKHRADKYKDFKETLKRVAQHPSREYFVFKSIIINNLFGVDIMEEAVEICKLRLFLKLAAQVEPDPDKDNFGIEPLPDIDFNIRCGNTLVGYAREAQAELAHKTDLVRQLAWPDVQEKVRIASRSFQQFRAMQVKQGMNARDFADAKADLSKRLADLREELDCSLAAEYGEAYVKSDTAFGKWRKAHQPFHWYSEFYGIMNKDGFDVVIGNPPYIQSTKVRRGCTVKGYKSEGCPDVYAWFLERTLHLLASLGRCGMIVPLSLGFSKDFGSCRSLYLGDDKECWFSSFGRIPSALFNYDVRVRNTIVIAANSSKGCVRYTTRLHRWYGKERGFLFPCICYSPFDPRAWDGRIAKSSQEKLVQGFERLRNQEGERLGLSFSSRRTRHVLHVKKSAYNWLSFSHELPPCFDAEGQPISQTQYDTLYFADATTRDVAFLLLNGKLMLDYWAIVGDDFHVAGWMYGGFPVDLTKLTRESNQKLLSIATELRQAMSGAVSFKTNAGKKVGTFNLAACRHITDKSDRIFAAILGIEDIWDATELLHSRTVRTRVADSGS